MPSGALPTTLRLPGRPYLQETVSSTLVAGMVPVSGSKSLTDAMSSTLSITSSSIGPAAKRLSALNKSPAAASGASKWPESPARRSAASPGSAWLRGAEQRRGQAEPGVWETMAGWLARPPLPQNGPLPGRPPP